MNFIEKSESGAMVRFVRVTYVRRGLDEFCDTPSVAAAAAAPDYLPPKGFSYTTFVPSPVKVAMCSGAPVYESFASTWERARVWLRLVGQLPQLSSRTGPSLGFIFWEAAFQGGGSGARTANTGMEFSGFLAFPRPPSWWGAAVSPVPTS